MEFVMLGNNEGVIKIMAKVLAGNEVLPLHLLRFFDVEMFGLAAVWWDAKGQAEGNGHGVVFTHGGADTDIDGFFPASVFDDCFFGKSGDITRGGLGQRIVDKFAPRIIYGGVGRLE